MNRDRRQGTRNGGSRSGYSPKGTTRRGASVGTGRRETLEIQLRLMLLTASISVATYWVCFGMYVGLHFTMERAGLIGLLFTLLYVSTSAAVAIYSAYNDFFLENPFMGGGIGINVLFLLGGIVIVFFAGMILQGIYGLGGNSADLLNYRRNADAGVFYGFLRIIFCTVMGTLIGIGHLVAFGRSDTMEAAFFASVIKGAAGAVILEGGIQLIHLPVVFATMLYWVVIGTATLMGPVRAVHRQSRKLHS